MSKYKATNVCWDVRNIEKLLVQYKCVQGIFK